MNWKLKSDILIKNLLETFHLFDCLLRKSIWCLENNHVIQLFQPLLIWKSPFLFEVRGMYLLSLTNPLYIVSGIASSWLLQLSINAILIFKRYVFCKFDLGFFFYPGLLLMCRLKSTAIEVDNWDQHTLYYCGYVYFVAINFQGLTKSCIYLDIKFRDFCQSLHTN